MEHNSKVIFALVTALIFSLAGIVMMTNGAQIDNEDDGTGPIFPETDPAATPFNHEGLFVNFLKHNAETLMVSESMLEGWTIDKVVPPIDSTYQIIYEKDGVLLAIGIFVDVSVAECVKDYYEGRDQVSGLSIFEDLDKGQMSFKCYIDTEGVWGYAAQDLNVVVAISLVAEDETEYKDLINSIIEGIIENIHAVAEPFDHTVMYVSSDKHDAESLAVPDSFLEGWTSHGSDISGDVIQTVYEKDGILMGVAVVFRGDVASAIEEFMENKDLVKGDTGFQELDFCERSYKLYTTTDLGEGWSIAVQDLNIFIMVIVVGADLTDYQDLVDDIINEISKNIHDAAEILVLK